MVIFKPETLVRWHRGGFRLFWRWKSRRQAGRPAVSSEIRSLVWQMSRENPLWGAPRIHGELLKLGVDISQSSVAKYMDRRRGPPSQSWRTFLRIHAPHVAAVDLFDVPTISFKLLYGLVVLYLNRRQLVWTNVTASPTAEWIARQITEAFPWDQAPRYLVHDRDSAYGAIVTQRLRAMGIRDRPIAPGSLWQTDVIDKRFRLPPSLCWRGARATAWRRAGLEVRALSRSLHRRSSVAALVRALGVGRKNLCNLLCDQTIDVMQAAEHGLRNDLPTLRFSVSRLDRAWSALTDRAMRTPAIEILYILRQRGPQMALI